MYDLIIVGAGIAGSTLATVMARAGCSVLLVEKEERFRDRIRGENCHAWGIADLQALGIHDVLLESCAQEILTLNYVRDGITAVQRDLTQANATGRPSITFFHPDMQEVLTGRAIQSGADVRRGAKVINVIPGDPPSIIVQHKGEVRTLSATMIVGADGRRSRVRSWGRFETKKATNNLRISGVVVSRIPEAPDETHIFTRRGMACATQFFLISDGKYRAYFVTGDRKRHRQIGGRTGQIHFYDSMDDSGVPANWLETMHVEGPIATFEGAPWWVDHPYANGVALVGDAAASPNPCFGCGLSLAARDVNILSRNLLSNSNWEQAANDYAAEHDRNFAAIHILEQWAAEARYDPRPERQHVREHAEAASARGDAPDIIGKGPEQPTDAAARFKYLGY